MTEEIPFEDILEAEQQGAKVGLNPMFGEWRQTFDFAPVPYGDGGVKRKSFRKAIQAELTNRWLYSDNIQLSIFLYLDVQKVLETSETADLDNYAKAILDALKGPDGIMLDDTQVQGFCISWVDGYEKPKFALEAKGNQDDFVLKPTELYEMPDGLWYPDGRAVWTNGKAEQLDDRNHFLGLSILEFWCSTKKGARVALRSARTSRLRAYQQSLYFRTSARGFHRSRVEESGFAIHFLRDWQAERSRWKADNPEQVGEFNATFAQLSASSARMIKALAGPPSRRNRNGT